MAPQLPTLSKRDFLKAATVGTAAATLAPAVASAKTDPAALTDMTGDAVPITLEERRGRIAKAQRLMQEQGIAGLLIEAGSAMVYFTGIKWWRSERLTGVVIPAEGDIAVITPYFEEPSIRERLELGEDVRTWHEHENPFDLVVGVMKDRGYTDGQIGIEETTRHFIVDGVAKSGPSYELVSGAAITRGCRMFKSASEIALMQKASDITLAAYRHIHPKVEAGMTGADISAMMSDATRKLGGAPTFSMCLLNEASAYPHGTDQPQQVREGGVILMDCGCAVHDYKSDISRTWVFGEPTKKQRSVWNTAKRGQELALETAQIGVPAGEVDKAVRAFYEGEGYGPGYKTPGLSHRLGHGIGMDGHEPINFVSSETMPLTEGMCFSDEPGIYIFGEFGVRLEDCLYMTADGPKLFTQFSKSIDDPMG